MAAAKCAKAMATLGSTRLGKWSEAEGCLQAETVYILYNIIIINNIYIHTCVCVMMMAMVMICDGDGDGDDDDDDDDDDEEDEGKKQ